jgi:predicted AAA+ superfamily ATPase
MSYLHRNIDLELINWKNDPEKKPLLLRGARQIGKSSTVRNLGKSFKHYIEINFELEPELTALFETLTDINELCRQISLLKGIQIKDGQSLLFLDEIQVSSLVIQKLRYFYELRPQLHVIAAGSLLEFAIAESPSFGVGRIRSMFMMSFSFDEYLRAMKEDVLLNALSQLSHANALPEAVHKKCLRLFKNFIVIGGMPEAVATYVKHKDLHRVQKVLDDLIVSYQADFPKYKTRISTDRLIEVFRSVVFQVGSKYKYTNSVSALNSEQIRNALYILEKAGLIYAITHSNCNGIPLGAEINPKRKKYIVLDTGIYQRILGLDFSHILLDNDVEFINKGHISELFVGLELLKNQSYYQPPELYYWHRQQQGSQAEVDYVIQNHDKIIPIEVKASGQGKMKSLHLFIDEKKPDFGVRTSLENGGTYDKINVWPIYAIGNLVR